MAKEKFEDRTLDGLIKVACKFDNNGNITTRLWEAEKRDIVNKTDFIVNTYTTQGYILSLRQLHYQFVTRNWIVNHDTAYKKLGSILDDCRYAGLVDWGAIEDRGRVPYLPFWVNNPDEGLNVIINQYRLNRMLDQPKYVELWTEKDALSGILRRSTSKYHIQLVVNKGYTSSSAAYNAYERVSEYILKGKKAVILYFGDHDPSGLDMIRDIRERLTLFLSQGDKLKNNNDFMQLVSDWWDEAEYTYYDMNHNGYLSDKAVDTFNGGWDGLDKYDKASDEFDAGKIKWYLEENKLFQVIQIGLTMEQIKQYNLPENPTKLTDTRAKNYIKQFGTRCWEVDALEPKVLTSIVETHIKEHIDMQMYLEMIKKEKKDIQYLKDLVEKIDPSNKHWL